jgi:hypothetical protein
MLCMGVGDSEQISAKIGWNTVDDICFTVVTISRSVTSLPISFENEWYFADDETVNGIDGAQGDDLSRRVDDQYWSGVLAVRY